MTRRILLARLGSVGFAGKGYFEAFGTDEHGLRHTIVVSEWLSLPELRSVVGSLTPEFLTTFGMRELVRTPFGGTLQKRIKVWKLLPL